MARRVTQKSSPRGQGQRPPQVARQTATRMRRLNASLAIAEDTFDAIHAEACRRFGRHLPKDPMLLDILTLIDVDTDDVWTWRGITNNKGLPTIRRGQPSNTEISLVRFLALKFDVIRPEDNGALFPGPTGKLDVNPWHRTLRRSDEPLGGHYRFAAKGLSDG